jgi:hypothetical protein
MYTWKKISLITLLSIMMISVLPSVYSTVYDLPPCKITTEISMFINSGEVCVKGYLVTLKELHYEWYDIVRLYWTEYPGWYEVDVWIDLYNPSNKWRHVSGMVHGQIGSGIDYDTFECEPSDWVLVNRTQYVTNAQRVHCRWYAEDEGNVDFYMTSFAVIDDFNGDGKIDIRDLGEVARNFGKRYTDIENDPLAKYDMDFNLMIDLFDVKQVSLDFGFQVPP